MFLRAFTSLRSRLIALTVVVEIVMISAIVWNSQRLTEEHLVRQFDLRRAEISLLLQAAIAPAMAQRDYAASDVRFLHAMKEVLDMRLAREGRSELAQACFDFLPTRAALDLAGWPEVDIFAHS